MGIRFFCPNGHRLNVKAHLAGKRGYCPHCGVKLLIPTESELQPAAEGKATEAKTVVAKQTTTTASPYVAPQTTSASPAVPASTNDFAWYVRPPSGGQFGPANSGVLQEWVREGRVPPESLVWREGWEEWRAATEVLVSNGAIKEASGDDFDAVGQLDFATEAGGSDVTFRANESAQSRLGAIKKKKRTRKQAAILLSLVSIALLIALVVILRL